MGGNLAKSPLVAVIYAALFYFAAVFIPFSEGYATTVAGHEIKLMGYLMLIAYCLIASITAALAFSVVDKGGFGALLPLIPAFWGLSWIVPLLQPLLQGEVTGGMTQGDVLKRLIQGCVCVLLMLLLSMLLYSKKQPKEQGPQAKEAKGTKPKLKILTLVIFLIVLPIIYMVLYFVGGYFLAWTNDAFRAYYTGGGNNGLMHMLINMLLNRLSQAGFALMRGLLIALFSLPLLLQLHGKRMMYLAINTMLVVSGALLYLLPNPLMPDDIRLRHLIANGVILLVYGLLSSFLLHTCYGGEGKASEKDKAPAKEAPKGKPAAGRAR